MIEEIKLLLPLLETATNGAVWVVSLYFGVAILKIILGLSVFAFLVTKVVNLIAKINSPRIEEIKSTYDFDIGGDDAISCYFHKDSFHDLLKEIGKKRSGTTYVNNIDISTAIAKLKSAK